MIDVMDRRAGATFDIPRPAIGRCPGEEYAEFAGELAVLCGFITAAGGWWAEMLMPLTWRVTCVGPKADVDAIGELVGAFNGRWGVE